ncbi:MAG: hypothetical protein AAGH76_06265 [Pseudomonadota bacterium]
MTESSLAEQLDEIRRKRGYLLPHHGLMKVAMPEVLESYDALYSRLTLSERTLSKHEHEFVWMAVLIAMHETLGTHHIPRYLDNGGSLDELNRILAITALAKGSDCHEFVAAHWQDHLPDYNGEQSYIGAFEAAATPVSLALAHTAGAAVHLCTGRWESFAWHIRAAYANSANEDGLAEALSLAMFPGSVPNFVEAAEVWREQIASGAVQASEAYSTWAKLTGQGGFNEASGKTGHAD